MNSVAEDIKNMLLADSSLDLLFGTNLHLYKEPAFPDETVTIYEVDGMPYVGLLQSNTDKKHIERPSIQIRIRTHTAEAGYELGYKIINVLHGLANEIWGSYFYILISHVNGPALMDWDDNDRARIVLNFNIQRRLN